ncbi:RING1 and YY1-binding protein-like isoform X2 [Hydractinia symbiolongicarpus]|uniref:RING1 and YY1-binding protein-like isoform X2 n=1 Tax=Hydractinia symbiolongicarpus TaxID=13093 RepID=UPI00254AFE81|nr:RING1 and YY1-binding protein-like isoform X2 [Hydractinia symbiolongicarpus]
MDNYWECSVCTVHNKSKFFKCEVCNTRKGTSTRKPHVDANFVDQSIALSSCSPISPLPPQSNFRGSNFSKTSTMRQGLQKYMCSVVSSTTFDESPLSYKVDFQKPKTEIKAKAKGSFEPTNTQSPYHCTKLSLPSDEKMTRRPLYRHGGVLCTSLKTSTSMSDKAKQFDETDGSKATESSFPWCGLSLVVAVLILLFFLIYYHIKRNKVNIF